MKTQSTTFAFLLLLLLLPVAFAAVPEDLYTRIGTDPTFQELLDSGVVVPGVSFAPGPVYGSRIDVNNTLLEQQTGVPGAIPQSINIHTEVNSAVSRSNFPKFTRWYQEDGKAQVFRLFEGDQNVRGGVGPSGSPGRIEAYYPTFTVAPETWSVWEGTYTIINPLQSNIFQLFHDGGQLWPFHIRMSSGGEIYFARRRDIPGLPTRITLATNMAGKSLSIKVRANGFNYEVYKKVPLVDADWQVVTVGSYQQAVNNRISFRWGMYVGSQAGQSVPKDGLLFVNGVIRYTSTAPPIEPPPPPPPPVTFYWDNNGGAAGFGTAGGVWGETTTGDATQGWSEDSTGVTLPVEVTTTATDPVNFGTSNIGLSSGTITVSDTVNSADITFGSLSGNITLAGGELELSGNRLINLPGTGKTHTIQSVLSGDGTRTIGGSSTLALYGPNTFTGALTIGNNTNANLRLRFNSSADVNGGASSLGAPISAASGIIQIGSGSFSSTLEFINASAAQSTDRQVRIGSSSNGSGSATILNSNSDPTRTLTFSNPDFNVAATDITSTNRTLTLAGANTGNNTISGKIIDNVGGSGGRVALAKGGTGTWVLAGATSTYTNPTVISAGTLKIGAPDPLPFGEGKSTVSVNGGADAGNAGTLDLNGFQLAVNALSGGTGTVRGRILNNATGTNTTLTVGSNDATGTFGGVIADRTSGTGTIALTKIGTGTQTLTGPNTYTGATLINGGSLALGASNVIANTSALSIGSGILDVGATFIDTVGTLEVTGSATIHLGDGSSVLSFADSRGIPWTGVLNLTGTFVPGASLRFGTTSGGLTAAQLLLITVNGGGFFALNANGYLVTAPPPALTTLFSDNFDGLATGPLNGTTPDITTAGAKWVAMNNVTNGRVLADGNIDVPSPGGASGSRGGSATLAFTPQNGFIYTLDISATGLNSTASHTTANRLYFGFAAGQSAANGTANQLQVGSPSVTGKVTQGFMTKVGYSGANGIANRTYNSTGSEPEWLALTTAFGGDINLRIVLDTSSTAWTATWYAKRPTSTNYSLTRATQVVADKVITSIGFGLAQFTSGRVTGFSLIRETGTVSGGYSSWANLNGAGPNLDDDHDNDGVSNGVEYFLGGNTNTTGFTALPGVTNTAGTLSVTWTKASIGYAGTYGTNFWVETSDTLSGWAPVNPPTEANPQPAGTVKIIGGDVKYIFPAGTRNFARLKVTGP